jgi:hypothetical protein
MRLKEFQIATAAKNDNPNAQEEDIEEGIFDRFKKPKAPEETEQEKQTRRYAARDALIKKINAKGGGNISKRKNGKKKGAGSADDTDDFISLGMMEEEDIKEAMVAETAPMPDIDEEDKPAKTRPILPA